MIDAFAREPVAGLTKTLPNLCEKTGVVDRTLPLTKRARGRIQSGRTHLGGLGFLTRSEGFEGTLNPSSKPHRDRGGSVGIDQLKLCGTNDDPWQSCGGTRRNVARTWRLVLGVGVPDGEKFAISTFELIQRTSVELALWNGRTIRQLDYLSLAREHATGLTRSSYLPRFYAAPCDER